MLDASSASAAKPATQVIDLAIHVISTFVSPAMDRYSTDDFIKTRLFLNKT